MPGVAFYLVGMATDEQEVITPLCLHEEGDFHDEQCEFEVEVEQVERDDMVRAVMVGDDREHLVDVSELTKLDEDVCSCGQLGCWAEAS
jgi:hypothetical protein